jgi:propionate CoA-transferase
MGKIISADKAIEKIKDHDCIDIGGFVGIAHPEALTRTLEERFVNTGTPKNLTIVYAAGQGDGKDKGINHLAHEGLIKIDQPYQFDFYDGGGLDIAFLGLAEVDIKGNVNVSKFGGRLAGCGGFINISQNSKKVVFCGTFTSGGLKIKIEDGRVKILNEGKHKKFIKGVEHITFSGEYALDISQDILYVTERSVFKLAGHSIELIEIAPGIDMEKDIMGQMEFKPMINADIKQMDPVIFREGVMGKK